MASVYSEAGEALQRSPLYVDQGAADEFAAQGIPFGEAARSEVVEQLDDASTDIYIAVLPEEAADPAALDEIRRASGQPGTYLVVLSNGDYQTWSSDLPRSEVQQAAGAAAASSPELFLTGFIHRIDALASPNTGADGQPAEGGGYLPLAILLAAGGGGFLLYRRRKRQREIAQLNQVRVALDEDITAYGEELTALDLDVQDNSVPGEARDEYSRALDLYESAKSAANRAEHPGHLRPVTTMLEEGRWLLACVRARVEGRDVPERRPPCFFDPRHGPSVADVSWTPPGGMPREVPVCKADAVRVVTGEAPESRMVTVGGEQRPYWDAGPAYGAWAAGYYGAFMPAMLWGTLLGSTMAHGAGYGFEGAGAAGGFESGGFESGGFESGGFDSGGFESGGFESGGFESGGFDLGGFGDF